MAELQETKIDPIELSNKININANKIEYDDDSDEEKAPNLIDNIYKSMTKVIEALNTDNLILNQQILKIKNELEFICNALASLKTEAQETINAYNIDLLKLNQQIRINELVDLKKKFETISDLQKHIMDTRNILLQTLDTNIKTIRKEILELKQNSIRNIIKEEIKTYISTLPSIEKKFDTL